MIPQLILSFLKGEINDSQFEIAILNESEWDGNTPSKKYWILLQAYRVMAGVARTNLLTKQS